MAGVISIGGLATGLDTNKIIDELIKLERRPIDLLEADIAALQDTQTAVGTVGTKLAALRTAAEGLRSVDGVIARLATSSNQTVLTAAAGSGAARGSLAFSVTQLARASTAVSQVGVSSTSSTIATGSGSLRFQVGGGPVQIVNVTSSTTLQQLVDGINALNAGVTATTVNVGTEASPNYRLRFATNQTGAATTIAMVRDDTSITVQTTVTGQDARFTVTGISTTFNRASNTFSDVLPGVTIAVKATGSSTVTVADDPDATIERVRDLVTAFNDLNAFVAGESTVEQSGEGESVQLGSLAGNSSVRGILARVRQLISAPVAGATGLYVNLASLGIATQQDGSLALNETTLSTALTTDADNAAKVLAGNTGTGVADELVSYIDGATGTGGLLGLHETALDDRIRSLQDQVADGERRLEKVELELRLRFAALEELVAGLQTQSDFLAQAFGGGA